MPESDSTIDQIEQLEAHIRKLEQDLNAIESKIGKYVSRIAAALKFDVDGDPSCDWDRVNAPSMPI